VLALAAFVFASFRPFIRPTSLVDQSCRAIAGVRKMKRIAYLAVSCAAVLALPASAQSVPDSRSYDNRAAGRALDIERQIQDLDESISTADQQQRISPSEADSYIRELREIETRLLDVRARTFSDRSDDDDRQQPEAPQYRGADPYPTEDDERDHRDRAPTREYREGGNWSSEHS
jgi:hypothetical protein